MPPFVTNMPLEWNMGQAISQWKYTQGQIFGIQFAIISLVDGQWYLITILTTHPGLPFFGFHVVKGTYPKHPCCDVSVLRHVQDLWKHWIYLMNQTRMRMQSSGVIIYNRDLIWYIIYHSKIYSVYIIVDCIIKTTHLGMVQKPSIYGEIGAVPAAPRASFVARSEAKRGH